MGNVTEFVAMEAGIRQLHARYADAVWRKDSEAFGDCFAQEAEWRLGGQILRGRAEITGFMAGVFPQFRRILMTFRTPILDIGMSAARTYVTEQSVFADGRPFSTFGIYFERFAEEGDRWRFQWRLFQTNYAGPPDATMQFFDVPDYGPPPAMPPLDETTFDRSGVGPKARDLS